MSQLAPPMPQPLGFSGDTSISSLCPPCNLPHHPGLGPLEDPTQPSSWATSESVNSSSSLWEGSPTPPQHLQGPGQDSLGPGYLGGGLSREPWGYGKGCRNTGTQGTISLELRFLSIPPRGLLCGPRMSQLSRDMPVRREGHWPPGSPDCTFPAPG